MMGKFKSKRTSTYRKTANIVKRRLKNKKPLSFMLVRHPISRIISFYFDKFLGQVTHPKANMRPLADKIICLYRRSGVNTTSSWPTFEETLEWILDTPMHKIDSHLASAAYHCNPCWFNYDVIAKVETMEQDRRYIFWKKNISTVNINIEALNNNVNKNATDYYKKIPKETLNKLIEK